MKHGGSKGVQSRKDIRGYRKVRIWKKMSKHKGERPRLVVYRSNAYLYAQVINDMNGHTVLQANTREEHFKGMSSAKNLEAAEKLGKLLGQRLSEKNIKTLLFDRNGFLYHGRVKAIADAVRSTGVEF